MKKLISTIMALTVACTGLASMTAGAVGDVNPFDALSENEEFADFELLYSYDYTTSFMFLDGIDSVAIYCKKYTGDNGEKCYNFKKVNHHRPTFFFRIYGTEKDVEKKVADILNSYEELEYESLLVDTEDYVEYCASVPDASCIEEIYNKLSEALPIGYFSFGRDSFTYYDSIDVDGLPCVLERFSIHYEFDDFENMAYHCDYDLGDYEYGIYNGTYIGYLECDNYDYLYTPTYYPCLTEEKVDAVAEYIEETNLDFTLKSFSNEYYSDEYDCILIPNYDITFDDHMEISMDIAGACSIDMPVSFDNATNVISNGYYILLDKDEKQAIEDYLMRNAKSGDANVDGAMNIADAAAVVQALGNKDKYGLSAQGEFNADIDGNGLTGADALSIQIMVAEAGMPE